MNLYHRLTILTVLLAGLTSPATLGQERLTQDEARRYADLVGTVQSELGTAPCAAPVDLQRPVAVRDGEYGVMVLPAAKLTSDALAKAANGETVPVGQLWLLKLAPLVDDQVVASDKLRLVNVSGDEGSATVPCCLLGVRKAGAGFELVVFGKGQEPIAKAPLSAITATSSQPLDLDVERENDRGRLTVKVAGKYSAHLAVTDPELY